MPSYDPGLLAPPPKFWHNQAMQICHAHRIALVVVAAFGCGSSSSNPKVTMQHANHVSAPSPIHAAAGVTAPELQQLLTEHWELTMQMSPTWATQLGDHRFDDQIESRTPAAQEKSRQGRDGFLRRALALKATSSAWNGNDNVTLELFILDLQASVAADVCHFEQWKVAAGGSSVLSDMAYMVEAHPRKTQQDARNVVARVAKVAASIDDEIANLRRGLAAGRVAGKENIVRAVAQLNEALTDKVPLADGLTKPFADERTWPTGERAKMQKDYDALIVNDIAPAFKRLRDFYSATLLPVARTDKEGLAGLVDGAACYQSQILNHVGIAMDAAKVHQLGLDNIARNDKEIAALGKKVLGTADLASTIAKLRTDSSLYFSTAAQITEAAGANLARAKAAIPKFFTTLPKTDCVMAVIPDYEAPTTTIAYYRQPNPDGSKPGEFFVNTYKPEVRARFEMQALTWHESIPGHHLQIAIAQELGELPAFRKFGGSTAFVEGWALYTERLADEMGLYSSDMDRLGMLSFDAWRSARLVVDTGVHSLGWTRAQAEQFMRDHTALTETNIVNEVDRYISWPGQALGYKLGQIKIFELRARAQAALGGKFSLPAFHEIVLGAGAVTLPVLEARVDAWIASQK
jgi:uncharacterized protein (DUF885 family)